MKVSDIKLISSGESCELQATVSSDALCEPFLLWYRFPPDLQDRITLESGNPFVAALLAASMKMGEPLELPVPVSPRLLRATHRIQRIYLVWDPTLYEIEVSAPLREAHPPSGCEVGLFFSLGIDSLYSLLRSTTDHPLNEEAITQLLCVYGADVRIGERKRHVYDEMLEKTTAVADRFAMQTLGVSTNLKDFLARLALPWGFVNGGALASIGLLMEGTFKKMYLASGNTYTDLHRSGVHPLLDPLWSTESIAFVHDGIEASRLEKTKFIAGYQLALDTLRVCWANEREEFNCGRCSKCLRTMLALHLAGALDRCRTLPNAISTGWLRDIRLLHAYEFTFFEEMIEALGGSDADAELRTALGQGLDPWKRYFERLDKLIRRVDALIPVHVPFVLVDQDTIREELGGGRRIIPFLERNGAYYGPPPDDETAVRELERLRNQGARFVVFWWANFWWLEYYRELSQHLRSKYRCILEDESSVIFELETAST